MKRWIIVCLFPAVLLPAGCDLMGKRVVYVDSASQQPAAKDPQRVVEPSQQEMQRRFDSSASEDTAVQNAVILAQKYEELSVRNNELREQNNKLYLENQRLQRETDKRTMELEQTKKDLSEANDFLQQMHVELTQWKSDVLGFRDEIRQSQKAQLEALSKILSVLGAEPIAVEDAQSNEAADESPDKKDE